MIKTGMALQKLIYIFSRKKILGKKMILFGEKQIIIEARVYCKCTCSQTMQTKEDKLHFNIFLYECNGTTNVRCVTHTYYVYYIHMCILKPRSYMERILISFFASACFAVWWEKQKGEYTTKMLGQPLDRTYRMDGCETSFFFVEFVCVSFVVVLCVVFRFSSFECGWSLADCGFILPFVTISGCLRFGPLVNALHFDCSKWQWPRAQGSRFIWALFGTVLDSRIL